MTLIISESDAVRMGVESAYNTPAVLADGDTIYADSFSASKGRDMLPRRGRAGAYRPAFRPVPGKEVLAFTGDSEIVPVGCGGVAPTAARGIDHAVLIMCGFSLDDSGTGELIYTQEDFGHGSTTIEVYERGDNGNADGRLWILSGCRADWNMSWSTGERWIISYTGGCAEMSIADDTTPISPFYQNNDLPAPRPRLPFVSLNMSVTLSDGVNTYSGGVKGFEYTSNMAGRPIHAANGPVSGIQEYKLIPKEPGLLKLTVDQTLFTGAGNIDPYNYRDTVQDLSVLMTYLAQDAVSGTTDTGVFSITNMHLLEINPVDVEGVMCWELTFQASMPSNGNPGSQLTITKKTV